jgi:phosphate transport system protein
MCAQVEDLIHEAVDRLTRPSAEAAKDLREQDDKIDDLDVKIENDCLKVLALHQPVANDLRRVCSVLKIIVELERVADLAVHIAERACGLVMRTDVIVPEKLKTMSNRAVDMLRRAIDAYVELDSTSARELVAEDARIDEMNREIIMELKQQMQLAPDQIEPLMHLFSASRHVERVADHATNIAEDVVYMVDGDVIRHRNLD